MLNKQDQPTRDLVRKAAEVIAKVRGEYAAARFAGDLQEQLEDE